MYLPYFIFRYWAHQWWMLLHTLLMTALQRQKDLFDILIVSFFNCMNVCCFTVFWTPETDLRPYHSPKDDRIKVTNSGIIHAVTWSHTHTYTYAIHSTHTCTQWLKECQISTDQWEDFTNAQKQIMCLSKETLLGLQMTGLLTAYKHCCYKWNVNITFL